MVIQNKHFHCTNDLGKWRWEEGWRHLGLQGCVATDRVRCLSEHSAPTSRLAGTRAAGCSMC